MSSVIGVIGGTALVEIGQLTDIVHYAIDTPFGKPSSDLSQGRINDQQFVFVSRHGVEHAIPPHQINYRANIWALREAGVSEIVAISSVGGIDEAMAPGTLLIPDQIIDYTWGRAHTFFDRDFSIHNHIEFTLPYDTQHRQSLLNRAVMCNQTVVDGGTMGVTQGPRLETAAEIKRMRQDGCEVVGMTGMPEAALARELKLPYACLAVVVNWAAGVVDGPISMDDIQAMLSDCSGRINEILLAYGQKTKNTTETRR